MNGARRELNSATPMPSYRVIFLGRYILVCPSCYSACSIATLVPDHRHRGRSLKSMCDHRDLPSPSNLNDDTISAQSFTLRDGHMPGARDPLCSVCHGRVAMLQRAPCSMPGAQKSRAIKPSLFIPCCSYADGDASVDSARRVA